MNKLLLVTALISVGASSAAADDVHEGYLCSVKLAPAEESGAAVTATSFGRLNLELRDSADCSGAQTWLYLCSTDLYILPACAGGRHFSPAEIQALHTTLVQSLIAGLRIGAFTQTDRSAVKSIWFMR